MVRLNLKQKTFWLWKHKFISLLPLVIIFVAGFFVYQKVATELNKRAFANARIAIDEVYADIVKEVGEPDNSKFVNECSEGYSGAYNPVISCSIGGGFIYGVSNKEEYLVIKEGVKEVISKHKTFKPVERPPSNIDINPAVYSEVNSELSTYLISGLSCSIKYTFDIPHEVFLELKDPNSKKPFYISMGCSDSTREAYYPRYTN